MRELGIKYRKEKVPGSVIKCWQNVRNKLDEPVRRCIRTGSLEKGDNWLSKTKQELQGLDMGDVWKE